jgi:hypothetical protein
LLAANEAMVSAVVPVSLDRARTIEGFSGLNCRLVNAENLLGCNLRILHASELYEEPSKSDFEPVKVSLRVGSRFNERSKMKLNIGPKP